METDERPTKRTKVNHERDAENTANATTIDVPMVEATDADADADAGAKTDDASPTEISQADAPSAEKSNLNNPLDGTSSRTAATDTATLSNKAGSPQDPTPQSQETAQTTSITTPSDGQPLSKNAQKRLRRQQEWDAKKADRKEWRKEKNQVKKERKKELRDANGGVDPDAFKKNQRAHVRATQLPVTFVIDCDFDDKMRDNERVSLAGQITRAYSDNKNAPFRAHLAVCSFTGKLRERFDTVLHKNYTHWKGTKFLDEDFVVASEKAKEWMTDAKWGGKLAGVFKDHAPPTPAPVIENITSAEPTSEDKPEIKEETKDETEKPDPRTQGEIIYLSSDSPHTLTTLKPYSTYIIGGLVDKNREKGICAARAAEKGIKTARLPIGDYLEMTSRKVLATNHVNEIMLRWLELGDWGEAFMKVIPKRKGGKLRGEKDEDDDEEEEEEEEEDGQDEEENEEDEAEEENRVEEEIEGVKAEVVEEQQKAQV